MRAGEGWPLLVGLLTACSPAKPASDPSSQTSSDDRSSLKKDAMEAMAIQAGFWSLLGISDGAKEQPNGWHRHEGSGTCMPKGSKSWELAQERTYARDDESVSVWNDALKTNLTLYTYPATRVLAAEFESVMGDMSQTCTDGPVMTTTIGDARVGGCVTRLESGVLLIEQAVLFQRGKWLHKARITSPAAAAEAAYSPSMSVVSQAFVACAADARFTMRGSAASLDDAVTRR
jgi:hypothetical protein